MPNAFVTICFFPYVKRVKNLLNVSSAAVFKLSCYSSFGLLTETNYIFTCLDRAKELTCLGAATGVTSS